MEHRLTDPSQACLIQGALIGWTVLIGVVLAAIFLGPPLFFDEVQTGYMYTGALVGAIVGFFVSGIAADWSARLLTRRNRGRYEPEFRLVLAIPQIICGCAGLYGFGITAAHVDKYGWFWPDFFFGLEVMGMVIGAVCASLYIVDAHRSLSSFHSGYLSTSTRTDFFFWGGGGGGFFPFHPINFRRGYFRRGFHHPHDLQEYLQLRSDLGCLQLGRSEWNRTDL